MSQFSLTMPVCNADGDFRGLLKPSALLRYTEQVSAGHVCSFGMDDAFFKARGVAFFVGRQALRVARPPRRGEPLTLTTCIERPRRGSMKRLTTVQDAAGQQIALVDSRWIAVDTVRGHILREPGWDTGALLTDALEGELPQQVHRCGTLASAGLWRAGYSLCDIHGHINNACYLDIACDALPSGVVERAPMRFASIKYNRQVPLGAEMEVLYGPSGQGWYVVGRREGHNAFECYLEFGEG